MNSKIRVEPLAVEKKAFLSWSPFRRDRERLLTVEGIKRLLKYLLSIIIN